MEDWKQRTQLLLGDEKMERLMQGACTCRRTGWCRCLCGRDAMPCRSGADDDCRCRYRAANEHKPSVAGSAFYPGAEEGGDIGITF